MEVFCFRLKRIVFFYKKGYIKITEVILMELYIKTFGEFDILVGEKSIIDNLKRSYKIMKLLQYFITFKNQKILPETIYETLWDDYDSMDTKNVIKGQIFRLKKGLKEASIDEDTMTIDFVNGYYILKTNENVIVDSDIFEKLIDEANRNITEDFNEAFILYNKAFKIYENQYLDNFGYELWLVPIRNYFRKLYVNAVENVVEQYKKARMNDEIINICQKALSKEAYEEKLHQYLIESLLANGEIKQAVDHIKYLQNEFIKGTSIFTIDTINRLEDTFEKHQKENNNNESIGIEKLKYLEGAMKLDEEEFKIIYQVTKIRRKDPNEGNYLLIIELDDFKKYDSLKKTWQDFTSTLITRTFRKSDVFTIWRNEKFLILLSDVKQGAVSSLENRFLINYYESYDEKALPIKLKHILLEEDTKIKL